MGSESGAATGGSITTNLHDLLERWEKAKIMVLNYEQELIQKADAPHGTYSKDEWTRWSYLLETYEKNRRRLAEECIRVLRAERVQE